jgi:hypothetical protein
MIHPTPPNTPRATPLRLWLTVPLTAAETGAITGMCLIAPGLLWLASHAWAPVAVMAVPAVWLAVRVTALLALANANQPAASASGGDGRHDGAPPGHAAPQGPQNGGSGRP